MRSDVKGFAFGLALGVAAFAGFGAAQLNPGNEGRYVLETAAAPGPGENPTFRSYLTDTKYGTVWELNGHKFTKIGSPKE